MKTLKLTKKDFKDTDNYWKEYIGKEDVSDYQGNIEIEGNLGYLRFTSIKVSGYIVAEAGSGIKAGRGIEAGEGIEASEGIEAGLTINCKLSLNIACRIFAGLALWKKEVKDEEKTITCGNLENGKVEYGILNETGMPEEDKSENLSGKEVEVKLDGKTYTAVIRLTKPQGE